MCAGTVLLDWTSAATLEDSMDKNLFWDEREMRQHDAGPTPTTGSPDPTILALGDSWFWYPFPDANLLFPLAKLLPRQRILAKGMNGAEIRDFVEGKYRGQVNETLRLYGSGLRAVFISGGGNDFAGFEDLRPLLQEDCSQQQTAPACFSGLDAFLADVGAWYEGLIASIGAATGPGCRIILHTYDYALPTGKGLFGDRSWLREALVHAGVPEELREACIAHLIQQFHATLDTVASRHPGGVYVVDSKGVLEPGEWDNELHPTRAGFARIAEQAWRPVLRDAGLL